MLKQKKRQEEKTRRKNNVLFIEMQGVKNCHIPFHCYSLEQVF